MPEQQRARGPAGHRAKEVASLPCLHAVLRLRPLGLQHRAQATGMQHCCRATPHRCVACGAVPLRGFWRSAGASSFARWAPRHCRRRVLQHLKAEVRRRPVVCAGLLGTKQTGYAWGTQHLAPRCTPCCITLPNADQPNWPDVEGKGFEDNVLLIPGPRLSGLHGCFPHLTLPEAGSS